MDPTVSTALPTTNLLTWQVSLSSDLEQVEKILARSLQSNHPRVNEVIEHVGHYRGKRLRPALLLLIARASGEVRQAHYLLGAVVEMIHTATLVHDDVLDSADMRRHVQTVNTVWGTQTSILLGDHLFTRAFHLASTLGDARACEMIGEATNRVCEGELQQDLEVGNFNLTEEQYFSVIQGKTAELIACCCRLGAFYSGASEEVVQHLEQYGSHLGIAFQIADDLLDLVGEEHTMGKSLGTDFQQQKMTLPLIHLLREGTPRQKEQAKALLKSADQQERRALLPLLKEAGSLEYTRRVAIDYIQRARKDLQILPSSSARDTLESLTDQVINRNH